MFTLFVLLTLSAQENLICSFDNCDLSFNNIQYSLGIGDKIKYNNEIFNIMQIERKGNLQRMETMAWQLLNTCTDDRKLTCPNDKGTGCISSASLFSPVVTHDTPKCKKYYAEDEMFKNIYELENIKYINITFSEEVSTRHKGNCGMNPVHNKDNSVCLDWLEYDELKDIKEYEVLKFENYNMKLKNELKELNITILADYNYIFGIIENGKIIENYEKIVAAIRYEDKTSINNYSWQINKFKEQERYQDLYIEKQIPYWGGINKCTYEYNSCKYYNLLSFENEECRNCKFIYEVNDYPCKLDTMIMLCNINEFMRESCVNISFNNKLYCEEKRKIIEYEEKSQEIIDNRPDGSKKIEINSKTHWKIFIILVVVIVALTLILTLFCSCVVGVIVLKFLI